MVASVRSDYNAAFTKEKYQAFLKELNAVYPTVIDFRIAETPVFVDASFRLKMEAACEHIIDLVKQDSFKAITDRAIPKAEYIPGNEGYAQMICFDFGICRNDQGELIPQLIEMQGFPTMYGFQAFFPEVMRRHFHIPDNYSHFLNGYNYSTYISMLKQLILGKYLPEEVVLLEWKPYEQKTLIDFLCTKDYVGIEPICISELVAEGEALYYMKDNQKIRIRRIFNRVIFDELNQAAKDRHDLVDLTKPYEVEWVPHPNWFYRISKFTLPFIKHPYVPETFFLNTIKTLPEDLSKYVLKPLFSFAGQGVKIDVTKEDIDQIENPENYILQKKVEYAAVIETPDEPAKAEIRLMYVWPEGDGRPHLATNLTRLSKGKMIGVRYNQDREWVGGTVSFFEQ